MKYNSDIHHRRSIRLKNYNYANQGAYFVTICTYQQECLFGEKNNSHIDLSPVGEIVNKEWDNINDRYINVELDVSVIMPNHLHGIIIINEPVGVPLAGTHDNGISRAGASPAPTLGDVIGSYKSLCTYRCRKSLLDTGKLWQRNYYEHVIRNEKELNKISGYIKSNPLNWDLDKENPKNISPFHEKQGILHFLNTCDIFINLVKEIES